MTPGDDQQQAPEAVLTPATVDAGYAAARESFQRFNLGLFGITGAGKSTLVNAVFGTQLAPTGIGEPVTQTSFLYRHETSTLGVYDTKGLELGSNMGAILAELTRFIERNRVGDPAEQIHVIWYCVRAGDRRIQPAEEEFIRRVAKLGIPIVLVMTQTPLTPEGKVHPDAQALAREINALHLPVRGRLFHVNAAADPFADVPSHGLEDLLQETSALAPEGVRNALAAAQQVNQKFKRQAADRVIEQSAERIRARWRQKSMSEEWVALFATVAAIYEIPETQSRQVLASTPTVMRMRKLISWQRNGLLLLPLSPAVSVVALVANGVNTLGEKSKQRKATAGRQPLPPAAAAASALEASAAGGPEDAEQARGRRGPAALAEKFDAWRRQRAGLSSDHPDQDEPEVEIIVDEDGAPVRRTSVGAGVAAGRVTRALGESWLYTCEQYWRASYPQPPRIDDPQGMAEAFGDNLQSRLPKLVRLVDDRLTKRQAKKNNA
ncbi:MAG: hypothetical protein RLZ55_320 [Actinomycetota bacterium]